MAACKASSQSLFTSINLIIENRTGLIVLPVKYWHEPDRDLRGSLKYRKAISGFTSDLCLWESHQLSNVQFILLSLLISSWVVEDYLHSHTFSLKFPQ